MELILSDPRIYAEPGYEQCLRCSLPDCNESDPRCWRYQRRVRHREWYKKVE